MNTFEKVIDSCQFVMENAKHVKIDYKAIDELIEQGIPSGKYWGESNIFGFIDLDIETIVNFLLLYQSIGFSFWGEPKWEVDGYDGSTALMYVFINNIDYFRNFKNVENMTFDEYKKIMKGNIEIPLLEKRYKILKSIATIVNKEMSGNFYNAIKGIRDDISLIEFLLNNFESFDDTREYLGEKIYFYKLATLLTSDILHVRNIKEGIDVDYTHIAGCSDYKIPQTLRALNIIKYDDELSKIVDSKIEIEENSEYEVEVRASVIEVERYIVSKTNLCGIDANDYLWLKSKDIEVSKPYHLTRTTTY